MNTLLVLAFAGVFAIALSSRCHPSHTDGDLHCADYTNMTCNDIHYIPYCHPIRGSNEGVCTCEEACTDVSDCTGGCFTSSRYTLTCAEAYPGAVEKICRCRRIHNDHH